MPAAIDRAIAADRTDGRSSWPPAILSQSWGRTLVSAIKATKSWPRAIKKIACGWIAGFFHRVPTGLCSVRLRCAKPMALPRPHQTGRRSVAVRCADRCHDVAEPHHRGQLSGSSQATFLGGNTGRCGRCDFRAKLPTPDGITGLTARPRPAAGRTRPETRTNRGSGRYRNALNTTDGGSATQRAPAATGCRARRGSFSLYATSRVCIFPMGRGAGQ